MQLEELKDIEPYGFMAEVSEPPFYDIKQRFFYWEEAVPLRKDETMHLETATKLYTEEQLEQAEQIGMQRIWDLLPESYQKEFLSARDEVIKEHLKFVEPQSSLDEVMEKINSLISEYDFPLSVLQDVHQRLNDCKEVAYAKKQLRYLQNIKKSMKAQDNEE